MTASEVAEVAMAEPTVSEPTVTEACTKAFAGVPFDLLSGLRGLGRCYRGKVRDMVSLGDYLAVVTTDRVSAFDSVIGFLPSRGQILNEIAVWWFTQTEDIIGSHYVSSPDPNIMIVKRCEPLPIEVVVRRYLTGTTATSVWTRYKTGERDIDGIILPDGMSKNDLLPSLMISPSIKSTHECNTHEHNNSTHEHKTDEQSPPYCGLSGGLRGDLPGGLPSSLLGGLRGDLPIAESELVANGLVDAQVWGKVCSAALSLFNRGSAIARDAGLILVDTKYEFGIDSEDEVVLIDEVHTPDSSRFWRASSLDERKRSGMEPENLDKEILRLALHKERLTRHRECSEDGAVDGAAQDGTGSQAQDGRSASAQTEDANKNIGIETDVAKKVISAYTEVYTMLTRTPFRLAPQPVEPRVVDVIKREAERIQSELSELPL